MNTKRNKSRISKKAIFISVLALIILTSVLIIAAKSADVIDFLQIGKNDKKAFENKNVVAEVNDVKIHEYEISMYFSLNEEEQKKAIDRAAALYLIYDYALKKGFTVSDMEVQSQLKLEEEWIQEATNKEIFYDYIAGLDMTASEYLQSQYNVRRNEMMAQKLYESIKAEISKASPDISADDLKKSTDDRLSQLKSQLMKNAVIKYYNN